MHNPYTPPRNNGHLPGDDHAARPIAVWLFMLVTSLFILFDLINIEWFLSGRADVLRSYPEWIMEIGWRMAGVTAGPAILVGLWLGRPWARWCGVLAIGAAVIALWVLLGTTYSARNLQNNGFFGRMGLITALMVWWGYCLAFSNKAVRYFGRGPLASLVPTA